MAFFYFLLGLKQLKYYNCVILSVLADQNHVSFLLKIVITFSIPDALLHSYYQITVIYTGNIKVQKSPID